MQATKVHIAVLDADLDARAERHGEEIIAYLSYDTPVWAREAAVAHLQRALHDAEGHQATVHLNKGESILVALDSIRPRLRAQSRRLPINLLSSALTLITVPFVGALVLFHQPWSSIDPVASAWLMSNPLTQVCTAPTAPRSPSTPPTPNITIRPPASAPQPPPARELPRELTPQQPPQVPVPEMIPPAYRPHEAPSWYPTPPHRRPHQPPTPPPPPTPSGPDEWGIGSTGGLIHTPDMDQR